MRKLITICFVVVMFGIGYARAGTWTTLDYPGATDTYLYGISGNNIVGQYRDSSGKWNSFLYNGTSYTALNCPWAYNNGATWATGISGNSVVGYDLDSLHNNFMKGFLYNTTAQSWTTINDPMGAYTYAYGISGNSIVGKFVNSDNKEHGFLCNTKYQIYSYTTLDYPGADETYLYGISGNNIVGQYWEESNPFHSFLYDGTSYTALNYPGADETEAYGISGNNIVGVYSGGGFLYNITTQSWTTLNYPGGNGTWVQSIDGSNIVGYYVDSSGLNIHGFVYEIPEPATLLLLGLGAVIATTRRYKFA